MAFGALPGTVRSMHSESSAGDRPPRSRRRLLAVAVGALLVGLLIGLVLPRGPVTAAQAVLLVTATLTLGWAAGAFAGSRLVMLVGPVGYALGFELAAWPSVGPTADWVVPTSTWGVLAFMAGRGVHGLLALFPMVVGAALGAGYRRRLDGARWPTHWPGRLGLVVRRATTALAAVALAFLVVSLARPASTPPIVGADGQPPDGAVAQLVKVPLGGADQWLSIRGGRSDAPVVLYLPGGPGQSDLGLSRALLQGLTGDFVVATLDGRGIGKAYPSFNSHPTLDQSVDDIVAAADYLRARFHQQRIFLFGESGGTITGVLAVQRHPERFRGWIGSGQMVDPLETDRRINRDVRRMLLSQGREAEARELAEFGAPPYDSPFANAFVMGYYEELAGAYDPPAAYTQRGEDSGVGFMGLGASEYSLIDKVNAVRGLIDTFSVVYPTWQRIDFRESVPRLDVPVYVFTGDHELSGRRDLADEWFAALSAPHKHLYRYPDAGHATAFEHADDLRRVLLGTALRESAGGTPPT